MTTSQKPQELTAHPIDYSLKWYVLAAVGMGIFLATIDGSIVNIALPTLVKSFNTDFATVQWVVLAYLLTITTLILSVGRLADMIGKKPIYTTGFVIFTLGSLLCGVSSSIYWLIAFRVLQAVGAAMIMALGMGIITEAFPPRERGKALGISGSIVSIGIVAGPTIGGVILDALSWHWIFYVNLPIGIIGTLMVVRFVPDIKPTGKQKFDYLGAFTLFLSLVSLLTALTLGQQSGFLNQQTLLLFAGWFIFLMIFIIIELRNDQPMIDLRLFKNKLFSINLITGFITFITIAGTIILMPFYLENVLGYNTKQVGLLLAAVPVAMGVIAPLSGSASDRFGSRRISVIGLIVLLLGYYSLSSLDTNTSIIGYLIRFIPIGVGMGIFQSPNNSAIMGTAPNDRLGIVSGLLAVTRTLGQTAGIAILGAIWASRVYYFEGDTLLGGATSASPTSQVYALNDTFMVTVYLILFALILGIWGLIKERQSSL